MLERAGVDTVFGYPGGAILNIYDALYKHKDEITHILTSHEQGRPTRQTATREQPVRSCVYGDIRSGSYKPGYGYCNG